MSARTETGGPELPDWLKAVDGDPTYAWARMAWRRASEVEGAWFDHQLADAVVEDWPKWARLTLDRFAGIRFRLTVWQEICVRLLVGWMTPISILDPETHEARIVQVRLFRRLLLWIPRKNGKTEFLAALALLFFAIDGTHKGEGYVFARKDDQARIVFNRMAAMVAANDEFKDEIIVYSQNLYVKALASSFTVLSGSEEGLHGKAPTVIVGDEMHEWKSLVIANTLRQGTGNRLEPIELYASTAGRKSAGRSVGEQLYDESRQIVEGKKTAPRTLAVIFAANDNDDPSDVATWRKGNPNLGLSPTEDFLREEFINAVGNPRAMAEFKCYHLGIWADEAIRWLPLKKWDACAEDAKAWRSFPERFKGRRCVAAFDVSSTTDITALVLLFYPTKEDPHWRVVCRFWIPEHYVEARTANGAPIADFLAAGAIETTPGDYVDQNRVGAAILEAARLYEVEAIGYDPWNARKLYSDLCSGGIAVDGVPLGADPLDPALFREMRQGIPTLGEPSKIFERMVFAGELDHGGDPVLRWMAGNVVIHFDRNLNFMPAKDRSAEKIDGIVALVMCVALACVDETEAPPASPWEDETYSLAA
jgi:phage terminase large subunit-like protein